MQLPAVAHSQCRIQLQATYRTAMQLDYPVIKLAGDAPFDHMRGKVKDLRAFELLPGAGHFIQQERPDLLNPLLLQFLQTL